jgi:phage baseplate assembly protein W
MSNYEVTDHLVDDYKDSVNMRLILNNAVDIEKEIMQIIVDHVRMQGSLVTRKNVLSILNLLIDEAQEPTLMPVLRSLLSKILDN